MRNRAEKLLAGKAEESSGVNGGGVRIIKKHRKRIFLVLVLVGVIGTLVYRRPMSMQQLCDGFDWMECQRIKVRIWNEELEIEEIILEKEDETFIKIMELFEGKKFRRSLWNLRNVLVERLIPDAMIIYSGKVDTHWDILFDYENAELPDGNIGSGEIIRFENYIYMSLNFDMKEYLVTMDEKERWIEAMEAVIIPK